MDSLSLRCVLAAIWVGVVSAESVAKSCSQTLTAGYPAPSVANGYVARLVAQDLTSPRGIKFDNNDQLLVVEEGVGITAFKFREGENGCIIEDSRQLVIEDATLNHGIEISQDGKTLFGSNTDAAYRWDYDAANRANTSNPETIVDGLTGGDHTTRTLLLSKKVPGMLVISRGSTDNVDPLAADKSTGISQVKAFDLTSGNFPVDFTSSGTLLGWGLRNDVGVAEEPSSGRIYTVENSADEIERNGKDIHLTNPAEELNMLGYLDGTASPNGGANFGYPQCFTAWDASVIPDWDGETGQQFPIGDDDSIDGMCMNDRQAPRLAFHPHMAPLDILFNPEGTAAWVTFHGSWNTDVPVGYKVSVIAFANGEPMEPSTSKDAAIDILSQNDVTTCYDNDGSGCFRPVGLAWDSKGRLFMSSDQTGELYAILRADGESTSSTQGSDLPGTKDDSGANMVGAAGMGVLALITTIFAFFL